SPSQCCGSSRICCGAERLRYRIDPLRADEAAATAAAPSPRAMMAPATHIDLKRIITATSLLAVLSDGPLRAVLDNTSLVSANGIADQRPRPESDAQDDPECHVEKQHPRP